MFLQTQKGKNPAEFSELYSRFLYFFLKVQVRALHREKGPKAIEMKNEKHYRTWV